MREVIALHTVTVELPQEGELIFALNAFCHHDQPEAVREKDDRLDDRIGAVRLIDALDEGAIDLQCLYRQLMQMGKRRVAGAEIVHREVNAQARQRVDLPRDLADVAHYGRLGDLHLQCRRRELVVAEALDHVAGEVEPGKLQR